ncbi:MAG: helix-turn-helix domain-containing protein [Leptolyngbyaceae cyanobacterium]
MTPRKLSQADKATIIELYRQPGETTSTLANRYGVSNSTISRLLKTHYSEADYEALIQQKRQLRSTHEELETNLDVLLSQADATPPEAGVQLSIPATSELPPPTERRSRKRSSAPTISPIAEEAPLSGVSGQPMVPTLAISTAEPVLEYAKPSLEAGDGVDSLLEDAFLDQDEELDEEDLEDDDFDAEEDFEEDLEEDGLEAGDLLVPSVLQGKPWVQVLPFAEAPLPKTCYLVVDRAAELIARPLKDFGDLGQIPAEEIQEKTLPVFDNHRVAKRFSNPRTHRVIKLPDGRILERTTGHLQAKGITRLLIDGQVYAL